MAYIREENPFQERWDKTFLNGVINASGNNVVYKFAKRCKLTRVSYISEAGVVEDAANYVNVRVMNDAEVAGNWSTQTGQEGTLPVNDSVDFILNVDDTKQVYEAGSVLSFDVVVTGIGVLTDGHINLEGTFF